MPGYLNRLLDNPSNENLERIIEEIKIIRGIIKNYQDEIKDIVNKILELRDNKEIESIEEEIRKEEEKLKMYIEAMNKMKEKIKNK